MPKRIVLLIHALYGGGAEKLMAQLSQRWSQAGHEVHLVTWAAEASDTYPVAAAVQRHGLDLMQDSGGPLRGVLANVKRVRVLKRLLKQLSADLVLSFSDQMNVVALEASRSLSCPVWISEHSNPQAQRLSRLWEVWRSRSYPTCSGCVVLTESIAKYMERWVEPGRLVVIPPAISPPPLPRSSSLRASASAAQGGVLVEQQGASEQPGVSGGPGRILYVGRFSAEKGPDLLLEAWRSVAPLLPGWELQLAGEGPMRGGLEELASLLPRVKFLGWVEDPWQAYRGADLFVLPSRYEGFPVAMLEAMSQGTCCIATHCSSAIDTLGGLAAGLEIVPAQRPDLLAEAILKLASDGGLRHERGRLATAASGKYVWQEIGPLWDRLLDS